MFKKIHNILGIRLILIIALVTSVIIVTPVQASLGVIYVKSSAAGKNDGTSWSDAYTDLQSALLTASSGDEIWVAAGTYKPTAGTDRAASFVLKNGVAIYGGFIGEDFHNYRFPQFPETILSGDIGVAEDNSDNSYHIVIGSGVDNSAVLDGFIITNGNANGVYPNDSGGGMYSSNGNPTLANITFSDNSAISGGGVYNTSSSPGLTNVAFVGNSADEGGGMMNYMSSPSLKNVTFDTNAVTAIGGGIYNYIGSSPYLMNVLFSNNLAGSGGGMANNNSNPSLTNVTFNNNTAVNLGGGIINSDSSISLLNVTMSENTAMSGGGVSNDIGSNLMIKNSILWSNVGGELVNGNATVSYSIVQGGYAGAGNLNVDPLLSGLSHNGGFTKTMALLAGSPAIDAGNDAVCATTDQRELTRPQQSHCDMGAFEYRHEIHHVKWNATGSNNGTSWGDAFTDLQSALSASFYGDEIWVAAGTYYPTSGIDRTISFALKNNVAVYGGFSGTETLLSQRDYETNVSILSGNIGATDDDSDNSYHVVIGGATDNTAILDGFTITKGNANANSDPHAVGGGMYNLMGSPSLKNLFFIANKANWGGGIGNHLHGSSPFLLNIIFDSNIAEVSGGGMYNHSSGIPNLTNVTFVNNTASSSGGGIGNFISNPNLTNVTVTGNTAGIGGGIYNFQGSPTITNITIANNTATSSGGGIYNVIKSYPVIRNTILWGNNAPAGAQISSSLSTPVISDSVVQGGYAGGTNIITTNPKLGALGNYGDFTQTIPLQAGSSAINAGYDVACPATDQRGMTRPQGRHCDIGAYEYVPMTYYVKWSAMGLNNGSSWTDAYTDLQSALSVASSDDEIWVAAGAYKPTTNTDRTISFNLKNGVAVYGGFAGNETLRSQRNVQTNVTTLSGDIGVAGNTTDNSYHVVVASNTDTTALLDGFTVTGGNADSETYAGDAGKGGGIYNNLGSPSVKNLIIVGNHATYGGGMYNYGNPFYNQGKYYIPTITNVVFSNNSALEGGGIRNDYYSSPILTNVIFDNNTAGRGGGGMENFNYCDPVLTNVTFTNNTASSGGGMMNWSGNNPILTNVTFSGNLAYYEVDGIPAGGEGGGLYNSTSNPTMANVTLSDNVAHSLGGGIYNTGNSTSVIHNMILWGNTAPNGAQIYNVSSTPVITDSVIQGGYAGGTNIIVADPKLGTLGNYGGFTQTIPLQVGSSAIDTGNDTNCSATDQRGVTRPFGSHCDIGAYEYEHAKVNVTIGTNPPKNYTVAPSGRITNRYGINGGPVRVRSTNGVNMFTSQRAIYGSSFNSIVGFPADQLTTEYWFTSLDDAGMITYLVIGNPSETETAEVDVYIGGVKKNTTPYSIPPGQRVYPRYGINGGPVRVVSTNGVSVFTSERTKYGNSFNEVMGFPSTQLDTEFWFTSYDDAGMITYLVIGNPSETETAEVDVYIGGVKKNTTPYSILPGQRVFPRYGINGGPVRVVSTNGVKVFTSERTKYGNSFNEVLGYPIAQTSTELWFTSLDDASMITYLVIGNPSETETAEVDVYIGGVKKNTTPYSILPGQRVFPRYGINGGPVRVVSTNGVKVFTSERTKYLSSFNEILGIPTESLTTDYWYTSLDDVGMTTELVIAAP
ncbi:MAG: hypothetical protein IPP66_03625 [Anaerolineales bacterium]|nr:hypothetical protein [Anaerolineales bacterium]